MPLITSDIFQARSAFATMELRADAAEVALASLRSSVETLSAAQNQITANAGIEHRFTLGEIAINAQQNAQQAGQVSPDLSLQNFIAALGLSIALAEATMPGRTISTVSASVQSFLTFNPGADGVTKEPGLRLYQPELGAPTALATTSFDLNKTPSAEGAPAPRSLYSVLLDKQALYAGSFWTSLAAGKPAAAPAIVAEIGKVLAEIGAWSFPYLLNGAIAIGGFETALADALGIPSAGEAASPYAAAVASLNSLTNTLKARPMFVAGDLYALTVALDLTTTLAMAVHP